METWQIVVLAVLWFCIGAGVFIWDCTKEYDLTVADLLLLCAVGVVGPFAILVLIADYYHTRGSTVLISRRKPEPLRLHCNRCGVTIREMDMVDCDDGQCPMDRL